MKKITRKIAKQIKTEAMQSFFEICIIDEIVQRLGIDPKNYTYEDFSKLINSELNKLKNANGEYSIKLDFASYDESRFDRIEKVIDNMA